MFMHVYAFQNCKKKKKKSKTGQIACSLAFHTERKRDSAERVLWSRHVMRLGTNTKILKIFITFCKIVESRKD